MKTKILADFQICISVPLKSKAHFVLSPLNILHIISYFHFFFTAMADKKKKPVEENIL